MRTDHERRPEEIEAEIERTRAEMNVTLNAIEERLRPGPLIDQGLDYLKGSGARQYFSNLGEAVKDNPLPVAMAGISLAWLMMSRRDGHAARRGDGEGTRHEGYEPELYEPGLGVESESGEGMRSSISGMRERAGEAMSRVSGAIASGREGLSERAHSAREGVARSAQNVRERMTSLSESAREKARLAGDMSRRRYELVRSGYEHLLREQPLALGMMGFALGALVAAALPRTRHEDRLMGGARDRMAETMGETAREGIERVKRVADAAREAAGEEAARQAPPVRDMVTGERRHEERGEIGEQSAPGITEDWGTAEPVKPAPAQGDKPVRPAPG